MIAAWWRASTKGIETPEREEIFLSALEHLSDPAKLRTLADEYERQGLPVKAVVLRKRAELRALPDNVKKAYRAVVAKALESENVEAITEIATQFENMTATGWARELRAHALDVQHGRFKVRITPAPAPAPAPESETKKTETVIEAVVADGDIAEESNGASEAVKLTTEE